MGKRSQTLPPSPSHSFSSSSDFEFTVSISPRKSSSALCPADELFYKGQLLPLHLSPRISMVRTLLLASSSSSSSATTTDRSRDSTGSSTDSHSSFTSDLACESSRPSSAASEDFKTQLKRNSNKYLSKFSSVFRKENNTNTNTGSSAANSVKRMSASAKEVIRKYLKKAKPLYDKLSKQQQKMCVPPAGKKDSFSGNLRYPRRRGCVASCPSSMLSSPSHSGVLSRPARTASGGFPGDTTSSMEELHSAIQGAIAHCKNSMIAHNNGTYGE